MTVNARSVAIEGFGFGALAVATMGFIAAAPQPQPQPAAMVYSAARAEARKGVHAGLAVYVPPVPICPPDYVWVRDEKGKWICRPMAGEKVEQSADYAILPLAGEMAVKALADGVVASVVMNGRSVLKLTADDGTIYYYANVRRSKAGRVKKDDVIGVASVDAKAVAVPAAPRLLDDGKTIEAEGEEVEGAEGAEGAEGDTTPSTPPPVFGVLPLPRTKPAAPPPKPLPMPAYRPWNLEAPIVVKQPASLAERLTTGEILLIGAGVITVAWGIAWLLSRKKRKPRRRRSRSR